MKFSTLLQAAIALIFGASAAYADSLNQSGVGNVAQQDVGNTTTSGSYNPHITANGGDAKAYGGDAKAYGGNASQHQSQKQGQDQYQSSRSSVKSSGNSDNSYVSEAQKRNPVATAFAAPLVAADDTCMGSSSAGGQAVGFGLSVGSTWRDGDCVRRKDARELHNMGQKGAAIALLCQSSEVAEAMKTAGTPCPGKLGELSPASDEPRHAKRYTGTNAATEGEISEYPTGNRRF